MPPTLTTIEPKAARSASGDHPLIAHLSHYLADGYPAWQYADAVAVVYHYWDYPSVTAVGPADDVAALAQAIGDEVAHWISLPAPVLDLLPTGFLLDVHDWAFRWTDRSPGEPLDAARWLAERDDRSLRALVDAAFPEASVPPGSPRARRWAGVHAGGELVAAAADATAGPGIGFIASISTRPERRGAGLGRQVTGWLADRLIEDHGRVGLWVNGDNTAAIRVYDGLGMVDLPMIAGALPAAHHHVRA